MNYSLKVKAQKISEYYKKYGLLKTIIHYIKRVIYSKYKYIFYEVHLNNLNRDWKNTHGIYFERYKDTDAHLLQKIINEMDYPRLFTLVEVDKRIKEGHRFYVAKKNDGIIGFVWYSVNEYYSPYFSGTIYLKPDEVFAMNAYVQKEFRGLGVLNCLRAYAYDELKKSGYDRVMTYIYSANRAAERMHTKFGSVPIGVLYHIIILTLGFRYTTVTTNRIIFYGNIFIRWQKIYKKIRNTWLKP